MSDFEDPLDTEAPDFPHEVTRPTDATPATPKPPRRATGTYPPVAPPDSQAGPPAYGVRPVSRPALPRQPRESRQVRPGPPPPPAPAQGQAIEEPRSLPARSRPRPIRDKRNNGLYLPWWSLVIMLVFVGAAAVGAWVVVDTMGGEPPPGGQTPIVIVVTATFTAGPPPSPTRIPPPASPSPLPILPTVGATPTLPPGNFAVGAIVEVVGVGQQGLNIRSGPGTDSTVRYQAPEKTRFVLKTGPQNASGDEWWEVQEVNDRTKSGWASRRYLQIPSAGTPR